MLSIPDMAIIGVVALMVFGPDQLPKVARRAGQIVRDVQNTSQGFIREMERAADDHPAAPAPSLDHPDPAPYAAGSQMEPLAEPVHDAEYLAAELGEPLELAPAPPAPHAGDTWSPVSAAPAYHEAPAPGRPVRPA
jgi:sec-independent protein translocase protein TatA